MLLASVLIYHLITTAVATVHSTKKNFNLISGSPFSWVPLFHPAAEHYFPLEFLLSPLHLKSPAQFFQGFCSLPRLWCAYTSLYEPTLLLETSLDLSCASTSSWSKIVKISSILRKFSLHVLLSINSNRIVSDFHHMPHLRQQQASNFAQLISKMSQILSRLLLSQKPEKLLSKINKFGISLKLGSSAIISCISRAFSFIRLAARPPKRSAWF